MKLKTSIAITTVALIALFFEFLLFHMYARELILAGKLLHVLFLIWLIILTLAAAVLAPVCAGIEILVDYYERRIAGIKDKDRTRFSKNIGTFLFLFLLLIITVLLVANKSIYISRMLEFRKEIDLSINLVYNQSDVRRSVDEAKKMLDDFERYREFNYKYTIFEQEAPKLVIFTPYTMGVLSIYDNLKIEAPHNYSNYSVNRSDVIDILNSSYIHTKLFNPKISGQLSTFIEYDDKICEGMVYNISTYEIVQEDETKGYLTEALSKYDCYLDIYDEKIKLVYVSGDYKESYDIDMKEYK